MRLMRATSATSLLFLIAFSGCGGSSDLPPLADATGYVTLDDIPLPGALVLFAPEEGRGSFAYTDDEGYFEMMYLADTEGAIVGSHTVSITTAPEEEEEPEAGSDGPPEIVPAKYNKATTLTATVEADKDNEFKFDLKSE